MDHCKDIIINNIGDDWMTFMKFMGCNSDLIALGKLLIYNKKEILFRYFVQLEYDRVACLESKIISVLEKTNRIDLIKMIRNVDSSISSSDTDESDEMDSLSNSDNNELEYESMKSMKKKVELYIPEIQRLNEELHIITDKYDNLLKKNKEMEEKLLHSGGANEDIDKMANENVQLKAKIKELEGKLEALKLENADCKREVDIVNKRIRETIKDNIILKNENENLVEMLENDKLSAATGGNDSSSISFERVDIPCHDGLSENIKILPPAAE